MDYEVAIIGGASAGLAAALTLGRAARKTIVFDTGSPRNKPAAHAHNIFTRDGIPPQELLQIGRDQLLLYPSVSLTTGKVIKAQKIQAGFVLATDTGATVTVSSMILATGLVDILPDLKGFKALWGSKIVHCPYCHGWEIKDKPVGFIMNEQADLHMATLVLHWHKDLRIFTNGAGQLTTEEQERLTRKGIPIITTRISELVNDYEGVLIRLENGDQHTVTAIYTKPERFHFNNELAMQLGCELTEEGAVVTDEMQRTSVPHVYAAGDLSHPALHQVVIAAAGGAKAGIACNNDLVEEDEQSN